MSPRVAIITGAGTGIGRASTLALLSEGWSVALAGRRREPLEEAAELGGEHGSRTLVVPTDVRDESNVQNLFQETQNAFGRLDLLFNNAGISNPTELLEDIALADWQQVVDINLTGPFLCTQHAIHQMKSQTPQGGRIINNGSISAHVPRPNSVAYTATKHAITGLTKSTSLDGRKYNIACGQIDIGNAETEMAAAMKDGVPQANGTTMIEPTMNVDNVARAVVHMAGLPLNANILFMTVIATNMPFAGRG